MTNLMEVFGTTVVYWVFYFGFCAAVTFVVVLWTIKPFSSDRATKSAEIEDKGS